MKYYIEAYDVDGQPILGNGHGQAVIEAKQYWRTDKYKHAASFCCSGDIVHSYKVKTPINPSQPYGELKTIEILSI